MTLDEDIEIISLDLRGEYRGSRIILEEALKLGIEALKRIRDARETNARLVDYPLIGETEE